MTEQNESRLDALCREICGDEVKKARACRANLDGICEPLGNALKLDAFLHRPLSLTVRQEFVARCLQGLLANSKFNLEPESKITERAISQADDTLAAMEGDQC